MIRRAQISTDGLYRYRLERDWWLPMEGEPIKTALWIMLNPSTADGTEDDPTIRRCIHFSRTLGASNMVVENLFAWRATKPTALLHCWRQWYEGPKGSPDPVGPDNQHAIAMSAVEADVILLAWGNISPRYQARVDAVVKIVERNKRDDASVLCFRDHGKDKIRHPLMLRNDHKPEPYLRRRADVRIMLQRPSKEP